MGGVLLTAASLSHVAMRDRVPDWEFIVEDEPLWSSSANTDRCGRSVPEVGRRVRTDLISGRGRQQMMLMRGSLQGSQNDGCQRNAAVVARFRGTILSAGGYAGF